MVFWFFDVVLSSQPKPEKAVIHAVAVFVLHDEFFADEDAQGASDGAGWPGLVFLQKLLAPNLFHFAFFGDGLQKRQLVGGQ